MQTSSPTQSSAAKLSVIEVDDVDADESQYVPVRNDGDADESQYVPVRNGSNGNGDEKLACGMKLRGESRRVKMSDGRCVVSTGDVLHTAPWSRMYCGASSATLATGDLLEELGVTHVVSLDERPSGSHWLFLGVSSICPHIVSADGSLDLRACEDAWRWLQWVLGANRRYRVFVHCADGRTRCCAFLLYVMMASVGMSLNVARVVLEELLHDECCLNNLWARALGQYAVERFGDRIDWFLCKRFTNLRLTRLLEPFDSLLEWIEDQHHRRTHPKHPSASAPANSSAEVVTSPQQSPVR